MKGASADSPLLGGRIEGALDQLEEGNEDSKRKDSTTSTSTTSTISRSFYLHHVDDVVLHRVACLLMEYLCNPKVVSAEKCTVEDVRELRTTFVTCLEELAPGSDEEELSFVPVELR